MVIDWDAMVVKPTISVFGEPVSYTPAGASGPITALGGGPITGVFDEAYKDQDVIDGLVEANTTYPVIGVRLAQFASMPAQNDVVVRQSNGNSYIVRDVRPDGHGWAKLKLGLA